VPLVAGAVVVDAVVVVVVDAAGVAEQAAQSALAASAAGTARRLRPWSRPVTHPVGIITLAGWRGSCGSAHASRRRRRQEQGSLPDEGDAPCGALDGHVAVAAVGLEEVALRHQHERPRDLVGIP
jgi:hypothetical protein